jgi:hypothetical protein
LLQPFEEGAGLLFFFADIVAHEEQVGDFAGDVGGGIHGVLVGERDHGNALIGKDLVASSSL